MWKICVILLTYTKPPCNPIPLLRTDKLIESCNIQYTKPMIATLLNNIEISRLDTTALEINKNNIVIIII